MKAPGAAGMAARAPKVTPAPPHPDPGPEGPEAAAPPPPVAAAAASGSSASTTLVSVYIKIPASVMLRLGVSARSPRQTFFVLIPEKPD